MAKRKCKICGKMYDYCKTDRPTGLFRYQDVACCKEHGEEYFKLILETRSGETAGSKENTNLVDEKDVAANDKPKAAVKPTAKKYAKKDNKAVVVDTDDVKEEKE